MRDTYETSTAWEKLTCDYCGCSIVDVGSLRVVDYFALRRDAFIHLCQASQEGRDYLANARRLTATEMDCSGLREHFGANVLTRE